MKSPVALAAALLLAAGTAFAQAPQAGDAAKGEREKVRAAFAKARKACEGKQDQERRDCMRREVCAQSKDSAACEARAKESAARRARMHAACKGKEGQEMRACLREQRAKDKK